MLNIKTGGIKGQLTKWEKSYAGDTGGYRNLLSIERETPMDTRSWASLALVHISNSDLLEVAIF